MKKRIATLPTLTLTASLLVSLQTSTSLAEDWKDKAISPVTNPLFFEDPQINTEIRPIFLYHTIPNSFVTEGGDVRVYAAQIRWAVTDRLAIIATKDGYIDFNPNAVLPHKQGWADLAAGLKYAIIDNKEAQFILTPGLKFELPTGNRSVFQGNGDGEWDLFVSAAKGWNNCHVVASVGARVPNNTAEENIQTHYSLHVDYYAHQYFIPFVSLNAFTVLGEANQIPLNTEGFDLINFGSSDADGTTQAVFGAGFRSRLLAKADVGFAYETAVTDPKGLFDNRFTVDFIWRF